MKIDGTSIYMTRGDSESFLVSMRKDGETEITPFETGDKVEMTIRNAPGGKAKILHKEVTEFTEDGRARIVIEPADTNELQFKTYSYDIQVTFANGNVKTIVRPSDFVIGAENTYGE